MKLWKIVIYTLELTTNSFVPLTKRENDKWYFFEKHGSSYFFYKDFIRNSVHYHSSASAVLNRLPDKIPGVFVQNDIFSLELILF